MKNWFQRLGYRMASFMYGRYGNDELTKVLMVISLVFLVLSWIPVLWFFYFLALAVMVWSLFRSFSKNIFKRRRELERYLKMKNGFLGFFKLRRNKWRDRKTHTYFKCPKCKAVLRVPRGKGSIIVTCPKCGERIEKTT
jgi:uncharacterized C2H2 Zn-finger protein